MLRIRSCTILPCILTSFYAAVLLGQDVNGSGVADTTEAAAAKTSFVQFAPYYNVAPGYSTMIELNNSSQIPFSVVPTLYSPQGRALSIPAIVLEAHSHVSFDIGQWIADAGEEFRSGSVRLIHDGAGAYALGAQIMISNAKKGFALDVPLVFRQMFTSSQLQAIWWANRKDAELQVAVQNTSDQPLQAKLMLSTSDSGATASRRLSLAAHEVRILNLKQMLASNQLKATGGGISIEHDAAPGAVAAEGWIFDPSTRFSASLPFTDAAVDGAAKLSGAGVMLGTAMQFPGATFEGHLLLRNTSGTSALVATPVLQRKQAKADLGSVQLQPGETKEIPVAADTLPDTTNAAGIEISHSGAAGDLIGHWFSVDLSSGMVVETPLRSVSTPRGGNNPWTLEGDFSSVLYVKNTGESTSTFLSSIWYAGGQYTIGLTEVPAGETAQIDLRKLRDEAILDVSGKALPPTLMKGQIHWQLREGSLLTGRVLTASQSQRIASNMSCGTTCCCSPRTASVFLQSSSSTWPVGAAFQENPWETDTNCDGTTQTYPLTPSNLTWSSSASSVAWVSNTGWVTCTQPGSTTVSGTALTFTSRRMVCDAGISCCDCRDNESNKTGTGGVNVQPTVSISGPNNVSLLASGSQGVDSIQLTANLTNNTPSGGAFQWTTIAGSSNVTLANATSQAVIVKSVAVGTASVQVQYTLNGQSGSATQNVKVQKPGSLSVVSDTGSTLNFDCRNTPPDFPPYTGAQRQITYGVLDTSNPATAIPVQGMFVSESFTPVSNSCTNVADAPNPTSGNTLSNGNFPAPDTLAMCSISCLPADSNDHPLGSCSVKVNQTWSVNGFAVQTKQLDYQCRSITLQ